MVYRPRNLFVERPPEVADHDPTLTHLCLAHMFAREVTLDGRVSIHQISGKLNESDMRTKVLKNHVLAFLKPRIYLV